MLAQVADYQQSGQKGHRETKTAGMQQVQAVEGMLMMLKGQFKCVQFKTRASTMRGKQTKLPITIQRHAAGVAVIMNIILTALYLTVARDGPEGNFVMKHNYAGSISERVAARRAWQAWPEVMWPLKVFFRFWRNLPAVL